MKQHSPTTGTIQGEVLTYQRDGDVVTIVVGSAAWFAWLEQALLLISEREGQV